MNPYSHLLPSFLIVSLSLAFLVAGCDNPGSVGSDLVETPADVAIDTLAVDNISMIEHNGYSGALSYVSAGRYQDVLFGDISATAMLKPSLPAGEDTVKADATVLLSLVLDEGTVYGDSLANQEFSIYEITEPWRDKAQRVRDSVSYDTDAPLTTFTFGDTDSMTVELPAPWVEQYHEYAIASDGDSTYAEEQYGLALVPENSSKIISISRNATDFIIQNPEADTFNVSATEGAYSLSRQNEAALPEGSLALHSTLENLLALSIDPEELETQPSGISKAELLLYRNNDESVVDDNRTEGNNVYLYVLDSQQALDEIELLNPVANGEYSATDEAYHFEITGVIRQLLVEGVQDDQEIVLAFPNNGQLKSSLIYTTTDQVAEDRQPKIVITSLKNSNN